MSLKYLNLTGLSRVITNLKNWVVSQIPTKTSEITNDSGFLTSHQSLDGKMTRGPYERIEGSSSSHKDLNNYITAGFYVVKTAYTDNCPTGIERDAVLLVYQWSSGSYCTQELTESAASTHSRRWIRKLNSTTWSDWVAVAFHGDNLSAFNNDSGFITSSSLPTVNNATLTIQKNGTNVQTFTANASSNKTANITVPTKVSELTNDIRYIPFLTPPSLMGFDWSTQYPGKIGIKVDSTWLGGILTTANTTIPTKTSELTNDSGFLTSSNFSAGYVTLSTQQNISANKFFYGGAWRVGSNYPSFICKNNTHTVGEAAPSSMWGYGEFLIQDKNDYSVCLLSCRYDQNATQYFRIECRNKFTNGAPAVDGTVVASVLDVGTIADGTRYVYWNSFISNGLVPRITYAWNIGDASHAWNIVYAANYKIKGPNTQIGVTTSNSTVDFIDIVDANNTQLGYIGRWQHNNGYSCINLTCYDKYDGAGNRSTSGAVANGTLEIGVSNTGVPYLNYNTYFMQNITPFTNDNNDLGDTSHHWRNLFTGEVHCYHQNALMAKSGGYTFLLRNDGSYIWFLISEANGNEGTWSGLRPLYINCANGACSTTSTWNFNKSFGDGDPSVLIQSGTAYANGTWNYPLAALAPNMNAGSNLFMPIGRNFAAGNCAGWHFYYAGNNSNDNFLSVEFYAVGSPFAVYRDGRVLLSASPAASDNSNRVATTAFVKANAYTHPTTAGNKHIPSGGSSGQILKYSSSGTAAWADPKFTREMTQIATRTTVGNGTWTITSVTNQLMVVHLYVEGTSATTTHLVNITLIDGAYPLVPDNINLIALSSSSATIQYNYYVLLWATGTSVKIKIANVTSLSTLNFTAYQ